MYLHALDIHRLNVKTGVSYEVFDVFMFIKYACTCMFIKANSNSVSIKK